MLVAYDDPTGVTGAFNLNLLGRINRELGGDFHLRDFEHQARWNEDAAPHRNAPALARGSDRLYRRSAISRSASARAKPSGPSPRTSSSCTSSTRWRSRPGFEWRAQWIDRDWPFAESLWTVQLSAGPGISRRLLPHRRQSDPRQSEPRASSPARRWCCSAAAAREKPPR